MPDKSEIIDRLLYGIRAARYWPYIVWLACKWMFRVNLGDTVYYEGRRYTVSNGTIPTMWRLVGLDNGNDGWVHRARCRKQKTPNNIIHGFRSGYRFYMRSWFQIWCRNGIEDWVKRCQIW